MLYYIRYASREVLLQHHYLLFLFCLVFGSDPEAESKENRPYAGVDYKHTLCPLQSRLQHMYHVIVQPYARVNCSSSQGL
jgi:hypothetical protein